MGTFLVEKSKKSHANQLLQDRLAKYYKEQVV